MTKVPTGVKWGGTKSQPQFDATALLLAAGVMVFADPHYFPVYLLLFSFLLAVLTAPELFGRCARVPVDEEAWRELIRRYQREVDAAIYHVLGFPPEGRNAYLYHDVLQKFRLRLLVNNRRALQKFHGETDEQARAYLCRIAAGCALDAVRRMRNAVPLHVNNDQDELVDLSAPNERYFILRQTVDDLLSKILHGRNKWRNILIFQLFAYHGLSPEQIAELAGFEAVSVHAIEQQITRIRQKLQRLLKKK